MITGAITALAIALALVSGASLSLQYAIMFAVMVRGVSFTGALLVNSLIGLVLLSGIELYRAGMEFVPEIMRHPATLTYYIGPRYR